MKKNEKNIILDLINNEKLRCLQFADENLEIILPDSLDLENIDDKSTQGVNDNSAINGAGGTAGPLIKNPVLNTKKKPCGLSHPFKIK